MKKTIIIEWINFLIIFLLLAGVWLSGHMGTGMILLVVLILMGIQLYQMHQHHRILNFLQQEQKKEHAKQWKKTEWSLEEEEKFQVIKKRVELYTLQSQINPHFLYNTLDSIRSKALLDGQNEIASMTEILSKFFRYCISNDESLVKIKEELNHIRDYYYIQKYRFEDRFEMTIDLENDEIGNYYIPKMTLQPLVENAMIHGLEKIKRKGLLELHIITANDNVVLTVSDNGAGMTLEQLDTMNARMEQMYMQGNRRGKHNSIAVSNVNARLRLTFGDAYGIQYRSLLHEGTDAVITIPIINDFTRIRYEDRLV